MRKLLFVLTVIALSASMVTAWAAGDTRGALTYNGIRNPNGCEIAPDDKHPTELRVDCRNADGPAWVRYRYTAKAGYPTAIRDSATVSMDVHVWSGTADIRWMIPMPKSPARTARIEVTGYAHILSVSWTQP